MSTTKWQHYCVGSGSLVLLGFLAPRAQVLEPPEPGQIEVYRKAGILPELIARAHALQNDRVAPRLVSRAQQKIRALSGAPATSRLPGRPAQEPSGSTPPVPMPPSPPSPPPPIPVDWGALPTSGTVKVLALLISFNDYPATVPASTVQSMLFGAGNAADYPLESLRNYYQRSSYGKLNIQGNVLGWYQTPYNRAAVVENQAGREQLIREALDHYHQAGHNFAQYDNDGDGQIDYFVVMWTGPVGAWASFWWGYDTGFSPGVTYDGKTLGNYSWQWQSDHPRVVIHETGHALGLPDYYDYDDSVGPKGGLGGLDMMDANRGDHNCFSKFLLDWLTPTPNGFSGSPYTLQAQGTAPECMVALAQCDMRFDDENAFDEYYLIANRTRVPAGNDVDMPSDGLLVFHVDARLGSDGRFEYNNSNTVHKLISVVQADGLGQIENGQPGNAGDYYNTGSTLSATSTPACSYFDGGMCKWALSGISASGPSMSYSITTPPVMPILCRFRDFRAMCKIGGCWPWVDKRQWVVDPDPGWDKVIKASDPARAAKLLALQRRGQALANEMERAKPARQAQIERAAAAIVRGYKALGVTSELAAVDRNVNRALVPASISR